MAYNYTRAVTIDHTKVVANQTDFPVLVSVTDVLLKTTGNGGHVENANGWDIIFSSSISPSDILPFEIEKYDATTGELIMWIKLPTISASVDDVFFVLYGNAAIVASQEQKNAVWDSNFKCVYHLSGTTTPPSLADSTVNAKTLANAGVTLGPRTGQVDGGGDFIPATQSNNSFGTFSYPFTYEAWLQLDASGIVTILSHTNSGSDGSRMGVYNGGSGTVNFPFFNINGAGPSFTTLTFNQGDIVYVAITCDSAGTASIAYLGNAAGAWSTESAASSGASLGTPDKIILGSKNLAGTDTLNGLIDEARFSVVVRSASWLHTGFNNQFSPTTFLAIGPETNPILTINVADQILFTDSIAKLGAAFLTFVESLSLTDVIGTTAPIPNLDFSDSISLQDSAHAAAVINIEILDSFSLSDAIQLLGGMFIQSADALTLADNQGSSALTERAVGDAFLLTDEQSAMLAHFLSVADTLPLSELAEFAMSMGLTISEAMELSDAIQVLVQGIAIVSRSVGDTLSLSDSVIVSLNQSFASYFRRYLNDVPNPGS